MELVHVIMMLSFVGGIFVAGFTGYCIGEVLTSVRLNKLFMKELKRVHEHHSKALGELKEKIQAEKDKFWTES